MASSIPPVPDPRTGNTRELLLDAAEELFGHKGYAATSLRELTTAAGTNLAAVNYHFGGKEGLCKATLARRIGPINAERLRRLDALQGRSRTVEAIVRAFLEPPLRATENAEDPSPGTRLCRLFGRISVEQLPFLGDFMTEQFQAIGQRFASELGSTAKRLPVSTTWWRMFFVVGAMAHTLQGAESWATLSDGHCNPDDVDQMIEELVAFAVGGIKASAPKTHSPRRGGRK